MRIAVEGAVRHAVQGPGEEDMREVVGWSGSEVGKGGGRLGGLRAMRRAGRAVRGSGGRRAMRPCEKASGPRAVRTVRRLSERGAVRRVVKGVMSRAVLSGRVSAHQRSIGVATAADSILLSRWSAASTRLYT